MREALLLRAARALALADRGDLPGACRLLESFPAEPEVAASTDPEVLAAWERIVALLRHLLDEGYDRRSRKQMFYSRHEWTTGKRRPSQRSCGVPMAGRPLPEGPAAL